MLLSHVIGIRGAIGYNCCTHDARKNRSMTAKITLLQDDITQLQVDAIVNAANTSLLGGGGVDGAIHRAAGPELLDICRNLHGCETGQAKITPGFKLPAKYVIHTVGPVWQGGNASEANLLADCYRNSIKLATEHEVRSIAFPAISCGAYDFPIEQACQIAVSVITEMVSQHDSLRKVILCAFDDIVYKQLLKSLGNSQYH